MFRVIRKIVILFWYALASVIIMFAVFGVALKSLAPVLNQHKDYIENYASVMLQEEVHIASIQANWARFGPEVHFRGVVIADKDKSIVSADELLVHIGIFKTIWRRALFFRSIELSGAHFVIREIAPEHYLINDTFPINFADKTPSKAPEIFNWLITQNHIRLVNIQADVARLNQESVAMQLIQANVYQSAQGFSIFAEGDVQAQALANEAKAFKGKVLLSVWAGLAEQKLTYVEAELLSQNLVVQDNQQIHRYPSFGGVFLWQPVGENWVLQAKDVVLSKSSKGAEAPVIEQGAFELWKFPNYYAAHIDTLKLLDIAAAADFLNVTPKNINLSEANIQGSLEDIDVIIPKDFSAIKQYQFSGAFRDVSSAAYQQLPEIHHLSGAVSGSVAQGSFILSDMNDKIYFPHYFNQPIPVQRLTANGQWRLSDEKFSLLLNSMHVISPAAEAGGAMQIDVPLEGAASTKLALLAAYRLKQSQEAIHLLPMKIFNKEFEQWLTAAIGQGAGSEGKVLIRGSVSDFPYPKRDGVFIVDGLIKPVAVSISPEWPVIDNVVGRLFLHNQAVNVDVTASAQGLTLTQAKVVVPDYGSDNPMINVDLHAVGEAANYVKFIHLSPLNSSIGQALSPFTITGPGVLTLHLELPINHLDGDHIKVSGQWLAQGVRFFWKEISQGIENIKGAIGFTEDSLYADHVAATLANEPLELSLRTEKDKKTMIALDVNASGSASVEQLKVLSKTNWLSLYLSGRTTYHAHLRVPITTPEYLVSLDTDMRGMKVNLPGDLGKTEKESLPLSLQLAINPSADLAKLMIHYTSNLNATINVQHYSQSKAAQRTIQVEASAVAFSWPITIPLPKTSGEENSSLWQSITSLTFHVSHLSLYHNDFSSVLLVGARQPGNFLWKIQANEAQGNVVLPVDAKQPVTANFDYLTLHPTASVPKKAPTTSDSGSHVSAASAASWPKLIVDIKQLKLGKHVLGGVLLKTSPVANGVAFQTIQINNALYHSSAQGRWVTDGGHDTTYLEGLFTTKNVGQFLSDADITKSFQAKEGDLKFNIHWLGSPMDFQLKALEGDSAIKVKDGVIPLGGDAAKNGLGKILTLFSAQSIQRRFQLNFSDLGDNGYSFNSLITTLHFQAGSAKVMDGTFDGPEAKIGFTGKVGLVKQDYDLYIVVTPYVTSMLPIIATIAGGPIVGVATYAFDKLASGSIAKFTSYKYLLRGPWAEPQLISLDLEAEKKPEKKNIAPVEEAI